MIIFVYNLTPQSSGSISDNVKGKKKRENRKEDGP
jgi:hypothetical protein